MRNTFIQGTLSIVFLVAVAFVIACAAVRVVRTLRTGDTTTSEDPYQESNFYAPERLVASKLEKKVVREYALVGDPDLIPGQKRDGGEAGVGTAGAGEASAGEGQGGGHGS